MERDVYISIRGLHQYMDQDGYDHDVEVVSAGKYYKKNGQQIVSYKEQFAHEDKPVRAMVKVDEDGLLVSRTGEMAGQMHFQPMRRNLTVYRTPFGVMEMGVTTNTLKMDLDEHNWKIKVNYALDINNQYTGSHEVEINVRDSKSRTGFGLEN